MLRRYNIEVVVSGRWHACVIHCMVQGMTRQLPLIADLSCWLGFACLRVSFCKDQRMMNLRWQLLWPEVGVAAGIAGSDMLITALNQA